MENAVRYICVSEPGRNLSGDIYTEVYTTPEEANAAADYAWAQLTQSERKRRHIFAAMITEECLDEEAFTKDGTIWEMWKDLYGFPGAFDSAEFEGKE